MESPKLIETGVYKYLQNTLYNCREKRSTMYYYILNFSVFFIFTGIAGTTLYYCYKQKKSPYEIYQKQVHDQEYILSKIRFYQGHMRNIQMQDKENISGLPPIDAPIHKQYPF